MDYEIVESIEVADISVDARSFSWAVDSAIKSETASIFGESPVHSFNSLINSAIRSSCASEEDLGASPLHTFASAVDNAMSRSTAAPFSQPEVVPNATRHVPARLFTQAQLKAATNNFSLHNKIRDGGRFGVVYRGTLADGRVVAIKRDETCRYSFGRSEFAIFSGLQHKNLVGLVGYCVKGDERISVYEYMTNGSLYDRLYKHKIIKMLYSWKMRIKIALDASRGIEYLHNYADQSIIHGNIKSSNILLDATWTARVSDFELSFKRPEPDNDYREETLMENSGYVDPEYLVQNVFTTESDVYAFGVVLLELLTGKSPTFKLGNVVEFAVPIIFAGIPITILDPRLGPPGLNAEALELVAYTAFHCVKREGKYRPTMADIVVNLERALAICDDTNYSISDF